MAHDTSGNHQDAIAKIASPDIAVEAKKLEDLAQKFLSDKDPDSPLLAFHKELQEIQKQGPDFTKSVFEKVQADSKGLNPFLPEVSVSDTPDGGLEIQITQSTLSSMLDLSGRDLIGTIAKSYVDTFGVEGYDEKHQLSGQIFTSNGETAPAIEHSSLPS